MTDPIVLIIDDDLNVLRLCQRVLEKADLQVIAASSSTEAIGVLRSQALDAVLIDIRMPHLDGFELLAQVRLIQPEIAAVFMTGFGTIETAVAALRQGVDGLVLKPFSNADLVEAVYSALGSVKARREAARLRALRPLFMIMESLYSETDLSHLVELIVRSVSSQLKCSFAGLYRSLPDSDAFEPLFYDGDPTEVNACIAQHHKLLESFLSRRSLRINRDGPGNPEMQDLLTDLHIGAVMCVPMIIFDDSGFLVATRESGQPGFQQADFEMLLILARQASLAMENAQLYDKLLATIERLERTRHAMSQAEKMASLGRLTASIAHEINNPLQALNNCLHLANRKELSWQDREVYVGKAQHELNHLSKTFRSMLDLYRPEARDRCLGDINGLILQVLDMLKPQIAQANIIVHTDLADELPAALLVATQMQQALLNLIVNAVEAMPQGGEIWITTRRKSMKEHAEEDENGIEILIEDTGPGLPAEAREDPFEPFASTKAYGTGLGLAVSYGIVMAHRGTLNLIEGTGRGACFQITLPEGKPE